MADRIHFIPHRLADGTDTMRIPALDLVHKSEQHFMQRLESHAIQGEDIALANKALVSFELQQYAPNAAHLMNGGSDGLIERYIDEPGYTAGNFHVSSAKSVPVRRVGTIATAPERRPLALTG